MKDLHRGTTTALYWAGKQEADHSGMWMKLWGAEEQRKGISSACFDLSEAPPGRFSFVSLCKTRTHTHMMFWSLFRCVLPYHSSYCLTLQCLTLIREDIILEKQITWTAENHTRLSLLRISFQNHALIENLSSLTASTHLGKAFHLMLDLSCGDFLTFKHKYHGGQFISGVRSGSNLGFQVRASLVLPL